MASVSSKKEDEMSIEAKIDKETVVQVISTLYGKNLIEPSLELISKEKVKNNDQSEADDAQRLAQESQNPRG